MESTKCLLGSQTSQVIKVDFLTFSLVDLENFGLFWLAILMAVRPACFFNSSLLLCSCNHHFKLLELSPNDTINMQLKLAQNKVKHGCFSFLFLAALLLDFCHIVPLTFAAFSAQVLINYWQLKPPKSSSYHCLHVWLRNAAFWLSFLSSFSMLLLLHSSRFSWAALFQVFVQFCSSVLPLFLAAHDLQSCSSLTPRILALLPSSSFITF